MRSSVSAILSGAAPEQSMSYPDYQQTPNDHQSILVVVRHVGRQLRTKQFNRAFDRISHVQNIKITDSQNIIRTIWIRYLRSYPVENNDWGDFQTHRKVLGLISIGQCNSQEELNELCRIHESLKVKYAWTLYDSRCILFGLNTDGSIYEGQHSSDVSPVVDADSNVLDSFTSTNTTSPPSIETDSVSGTLPQTSRSVDSLKKLGPSLSSSMEGSFSEEMVTNDPNSERVVRTFTLGAADETGNENEDNTENTIDAISSGDDESSSTRSESVTGNIQYSNLGGDPGSTEKIKGNLDINRLPNPETGSCYSGSSGSAGSKSLIPPSNFKATPLFYPTMELSQNLEHDIEEFVSALFWILESKRLDKLGLRKADRSLLLSTLCAPFEKKDFVGLDLESKNNKRRADGRLKKQLGDLSLQAGLPQEAIIHYNNAVEILKSVNDWLWLAGALEGVCSSSVCVLYPQLRRSPTLQRNSSLQPADIGKGKTASSGSLPPGFDPADLRSSSDSLVSTFRMNQNKNYCLTQLELLEKFREAVTHYGKYRQAGIIETEASIKAALVLIEQKQTLHAADFLQNAVFISLQLTEEEKMQRFNALSDLYSRLGFHRKAAFFKRVAAMRCVSPSNPQPNWNLCHSLLMQLMTGYNLSINASEPYKFGYYGWPRLQIQILQELVGTAKRKGNNAVATRHMTLLLHTMLPHLTRDEKREFAMQLELISKESEGLPVPIVLENGLIIPPVHLSNVPMMKVFRLVPPTPHLRAEKKPDDLAEQDASPFFYSFLPLTSRDKINAAKDCTKAEFCWVEGELCEVNLLLENPLPIELRLNSMSLVTEGVNFQVNSNVISIPADSTKFPATLTGIPLAPGNLRILGYSTYTLGVKSSIRLKNCLPVAPYPHIDVEIVPSLPSLEIETNKPKSEFFSSFSDSIITSASVSLLMGETQECTITLTNTGKVPVESIEINLESRIEKYTDEIFNWSQSNLQSQLPIGPGGSASFTVYIHGIGDFIGQPSQAADGSGSGGGIDTSSVSSLTLGNQPSLEGPSSLPSRLGGVISEKLRTKRTESSASNRSSVKSGSSLNSFAVRTPQPSLTSASKTYEAVLKLKYSGGPGINSGHFRCCGVALNVEVSPSLYIVKWDTLPGESTSQFYLVLDVFNATQQEMELEYTKSKQILIEKLETCRVPVPLDRCQLTNIERGQEEAAANKHIVDNVDLRWNIPDVSGKAALNGIHLTHSMVQHVIVSPIQWEITINGESVKSEEMYFEAGEMINVGIWLKNHLRDKLENILLSLDCFQDYQNGRCNYRLDSRFAVIGNDAIRIPKIEPGNTFQHSLSLIFFVSGLYKLDFKCNSKDINTECNSVGSSLEQLIWKYNPPLDIQIR